MKRYRVVFSHIGNHWNSPYFRIEVRNSDELPWARVGSDKDFHTCEVAHRLVREIIHGEGEYVVIPTSVERFGVRH